MVVIDKHRNVYLMVILFCLVLYPMLGVAFMSIYILQDYRLDKFILLFLVCLFFSSLFLLRNFGISFSSDSVDDVPSYLSYFNNIKNDGFFQVMKWPFNNEPIYWMIFSILGYVTGYNEKLFLFFNYFGAILILTIALKRIVYNYWMIAFIFIISLNSVYFYQTMHILRQSLAFSISVLALSFFIKNDNKKALLLFGVSSLTHYSNFIFLFSVVFCLFFQSGISVRIKRVVVVLCMLLIVLVQFIFSFQLKVIEFYLEQGSSTLIFFSFLKNLFFLLFIIAMYYGFKELDTQISKLSLFLLPLSVFLLMFSSFPALLARFGMMVRFLLILDIFFILTYYINKYSKFKTYTLFYLYITAIVMFLVVIRSNGPIQYLLYGNIPDLFTFNLMDYIELIK